MKTFREAIQTVSAFLSTTLHTETGTPLVQRLHDAISATWTPPQAGLSQQTDVVLYCLDILKAALAAAVAENHQLGIKDWRQIHALTEIILVLGLYKSLSPGVGVPEFRRVKSIILAAEGRQDAIPVTEKALLLRTIVSYLRMFFEDGGEVAETLKAKYLVELVSAMADLAFNPAFPSEDRVSSKPDYESFIERLPLSSILATLTSILHSQTPSWLRGPLTRQLSSIPMQKERHGVRTVVQFLLGKHKQPTIAQLNHIAKVVGSIPSWVSAEDYIENIAPQVMELLDEDDMLLSASGAHIIAFIFSQHSELVKHHLVGPIQSVFSPQVDASHHEPGELVWGDEAVRRSLRKLQLIVSIPSPVLISAILSPVIFTLFLLSVYTHGTHHTQLRAHVAQLMHSYIKSSPSPATDILDLTEKMLISSQSLGWQFVAGDAGGIAIHASSETVSGLGLDEIQIRVEVILELLYKAPEEVKAESFIRIMRRWLHSKGTIDPMSTLANTLLLQEFITRYQQDITKEPSAVIQLCVEILSDSLHSGDTIQVRSSILQLDNIIEKDQEEEDSDDSVVDMALGLLSGITAESVQREVSPTEISALESALTVLGQFAIKDKATHRRSQARHIISFVRARIALTNPSTELHPTSDEEIYQQAMEYISDPIVPVRAQGISILKDLILKKSSTVNVDAVLETLVGTLQDDDSYVYLNAIKAIRALADIYHNRLLNTIMDKYESPNFATDVKIRLAEVLAGLIQQMGQLFTGNIAKDTISRILQLVSIETDWRVRVSAIGLVSVCGETAPELAGPIIEMAVHLFRVNDLTFKEEGEDAAPLRRGAVTVVGAVLRGGGIDALGRFSKDVVRSLRYLARSDSDDTVKELAQGALNMLSGVVEDNSLDRRSYSGSIWNVV